MIIVLATMLEIEINFQLLIQCVESRYAVTIISSLFVIIAFILRKVKIFIMLAPLR